MKKVKKVWGYELWIANKEYCGKLLVLKRGFQCSLHYHQKKDETFYLVRGKILIELNGKKWLMKPGDSCHIAPKDLHRFTGLTSAELIEFSTHHEDSDTYRKTKSGKVKLRVAYDYDGVISGGIKPEKDALIITGRSFEELDRISEEIKKSHPIYFNPITISEKNLKREIKWKSAMIRKLGIEEYYEDRPEIVVRLQELCPNCHIVKV